MTAKTVHALAFLIFALPGLAACQDKAAAPRPFELTRSAVGHYCNMIVADHPGPKAQIHERDRSEPLWFSSVRDGLAYMTLPGEAQHVTAVYVHDMARASGWTKPQNDGIWIEAEGAHYVIGSSKRGGMGAQETVPFSDPRAAEAFRAEFGGRVVKYDDIPESYIVGDQNDHRTVSQNSHAPAHGGRHDD